MNVGTRAEQSDPNHLLLSSLISHLHYQDTGPGKGQSLGPPRGSRGPEAARQLRRNCLVQLSLEGPGEDDVTAVIITQSIRRSEMAAISGTLVVQSHANGCLPLRTGLRKVPQDMRHADL
ncbi:hypothetical protein KOW79_017901 [Hemibagrus wyckioides]|uniref:Uncharacterized protein n=1 Tax=Hemibagrus wyckioides TaxID=337641 RepID=A0A9D3N7I8_9TELE|nr:hypothetical protein KOW79_017901 [Hemibagrus wyckioides]